MGYHTQIAAVIEQDDALRGKRDILKARRDPGRRFGPADWAAFVLTGDWV